MSSPQVTADEQPILMPADRRLARAAWLLRSAALLGLAGAVVLQGALLCLVARIAFGIDHTVLPSLSASACGLGLGAAMWLGCRRLADMPWPVAAEQVMPGANDAT